MCRKVLFLIASLLAIDVFATSDAHLEQEIAQLRRQTMALQAQLDRLQTKLVAQKRHKKPAVVHHHDHDHESHHGVHHHDHVAATRSQQSSKSAAEVAQSTQRSATTPAGSSGIGRSVHNFIYRKLEQKPAHYHSSLVSVHSMDRHPESLEFFPTALVADEHVVTYIAGTPIVTVPYLGARPAFDGSDMIVNISSINRDIRLMEQRRNLYRAYAKLGYPIPHEPIIALSGKIEPLVTFNQPYYGEYSGDLNLGSTELDVAAALNDRVQGFIGIVYDNAPPSIGGQRVSNSAFSLSLGFVNIGNLDESPFYFTAGQLYAPFGRYSSSMVSGTLPMMVARTLTRPFILGYKTQEGSGPYAALYAFKSDTSLGNSGVGGVNLGYTLLHNNVNGDFGVGYIGTLADSLGMQSNNMGYGYFGGFAAPGTGSEAIKKIPGANVHGNVSIDRYNFAAEWVTATQPFRAQDLSFNGAGARPQAGQLETSVTFKAFDKPATLGVGYQWTQQALALNLPQQRIIGVFNISLWKDTIESLEYRHDIDYGVTQYANGASTPPVVNNNIIGTGKAADSVTAQIGVFF